MRFPIKEPLRRRTYWRQREGGRDGEVPKNKMDERIRSMYARTVREESQGEKISKKTQEEVYHLLEGEGHESQRFERSRIKRSWWPAWRKKTGL